VSDVRAMTTPQLISSAATFAQCFEARGMIETADLIRELGKRLTATVDDVNLRKALTEGLS